MLGVNHLMLVQPLSAVVQGKFTKESGGGMKRKRSEKKKTANINPMGHKERKFSRNNQKKGLEGNCRLSQPRRLKPPSKRGKSFIRVEKFRRKRNHATGKSRP